MRTSLPTGRKVVTHLAVPALMGRAEHPTMDLPCTSNFMEPVGAGLDADRWALMVTTWPTVEPKRGEAVMATDVVRKTTG
jgi:hypothetical protein